jgi:hypothetical protein
VSRNTFSIIGALLLALAVTAGCQRSQVDDPLTTNYAADNAQADMQFWHGLTERSAVSNDEALHALIIFDNAQGDPHDSYRQRVKALKNRGLLSASFDRPANETVTCGTVARVLVGLLDIKGGVTMQLVGNQPRYAVRELVHEQIMPQSSPQQGLTGVQFVGILDRARQYAERKQ